MKKYIFVSGGVISGVGKGVTAASLGFILKSYGVKVTSIKADPYVNVDAGTMNPMEHGETFVLEDGLETDMDLGHYERFIGDLLTKENYMTTGSVYQSVINRERALGYDGKCVEVVPHVPGEIINRIGSALKRHRAEVVIFEIGGTVGEYQNALFLEANRILKQANPDDVVHVHVSYLPIPSTLGEMKTKPTQISVRMVNNYGIFPDFIVARGTHLLDEIRRKKLAYFCNLNSKRVISAPDVKSIYDVPVNFEKEKVGKLILESLGIKKAKRGRLFDEWKSRTNKIKELTKKVNISIVGKYYKSGDFSVKDSYVSVIEAIKHASWQLGVIPEIKWFIADGFEKDKSKQKELLNSDAIIIPQGWGSRGVEGKLEAVRIARENKIPYLGLCFGMQMAVIEYARNVVGLKKANSEEVDPKTPHPVIHLMNSQKELIAKKHYGGTIRLGAWPCKIDKSSLMYSVYNKYKNPIFKKSALVAERHRHRYEFNLAYRDSLAKAGLNIAGVSPDGLLVEAIELDPSKHPYFIATQYHPELKSQFLNPHPLFLGLVENAIKQGTKNKKSK